MSLYRFTEYIQRWYALHGRHELPWRHTDDPYHILISELMLQQTQVDRVVPKYIGFLQRFPTLASIAEASQAAIMQQWQGLGYNRRARYLHLLARELFFREQDLPRDFSTLTTLPGIGNYTAAAIMNFAYNIPTPLVETNVRTVIIYHFFPESLQISDREILSIVEETLDKRSPATWYWGIMDYGSYLKRTVPSQTMRSRHYKKQSKFVGSTRQLRGAIIRLLSATGSASYEDLLRTSSGDTSMIPMVLDALLDESLITFEDGVYRLAV